MSKIIVPLHFAKLNSTPTVVETGFKKFYLKGEWFKVYNGVSEIDLVLDRPLDNYIPIIGTITSADTVLTAIEKLGYAINNISVATTWGSITGSIVAQTDLISYLGSNYYPLLSNPAGYLTTETDPIFTAWLATPPDTSIFNNDGDDGINPFISLADLPYQIEIYADITLFPAVGNDVIVYLAEDTGIFYLWNNTTLSYDQITSNAFPTGLERLTEGPNTGWRLIGRNPLYYGPIGVGAVDLSSSASVSSVFGATGTNAFAVGQTVTASGQGSVAVGGNRNDATGPYSFIGGGSQSDASGNNASVMSGYFAKARSFCEFAIGSYNTDYTPTSTTGVSPTDRSFVVGIGTIGNLKDGLTGYKNGAVKFFVEALANITNGVAGFFIFNSTDNNRPYIHNGTTWKALAYTDDSTISTLQEVLDNNHDLVDGKNYQGTGAGVSNTGLSVNALGPNAGLLNSGSFANLLGTNAGKQNSGSDLNAFGKDAGQVNSGVSVNAFGSGSGTSNLGTNVNAFGNQAGGSNSGNNLNALGFLAGQSNSGTNVNALGVQAGWINIFKNVNLFGYFASADADNQTVFSKWISGTTKYLARLSFNNITADRKYELPDASGTLALLSDIPTAGLTSVGLSMPVAFSVANTPLISNGTLAVTAIGTATQYIRGDGQLATFPTAGGGGSSVFYYLNGSIVASVATYKQMSNTAIIGAGTDFNLSGDGLIAQFLTDAGNPNRLEIPGGAWNFEMFFSMSSSGGTPKFYVELLKYDGAVFTSIANGSAVPETISGGTSIDLYLSSLAVPTTTLLLTDRLAVRVYIVNNSGGRTATLHTEDGHLCQIITTFSAGISAINGLTSNNQYLAVGTSGSDFNINSLSETHTFNLPSASATNRGALTSSDWTAFDSKQNALGFTPENVANKENTTLDNSSTKYPTNNLVKTFLDEDFSFSTLIDNGLTYMVPPHNQSTYNFLRVTNVTSTGNEAQSTFPTTIQYTTTAVAGTLGFFRGTTITIGSTNFVTKSKFKIITIANGARFFNGFTTMYRTLAPTNIEPNTMINSMGVCKLSTSDNLHFMYNDGSGLATTIDLGVNFPATTIAGYEYILEFIRRVGVTDVTMILTRNDGLTTSTIISTNIPIGNRSHAMWITNNTTASIVKFAHNGSVYNTLT
jgi:hypothetical protein